MPNKDSNTTNSAVSDNKQKKTRLSQSDVPNASFSQALRISQAIYENYGGHPSTPIEVAQALGMTPTSGSFRNLCGASVAYGLTDGGYNVTEIAKTELADRIFKPQEEGSDVIAKCESLLTPRIVREFLEKYDGSQLPATNIAENVLEKMGVPTNRKEAVHKLILSEAIELGLVRQIKGKGFVQLKGVRPSLAKEKLGSNDPLEEEQVQDVQLEERNEHVQAREQPVSPIFPREQNDRVFVTHGKNRGLVAPIKKLLEFGKFQAVASVEQQSISKPVPDKVMDDMCSCSAAIIHVDDELRLMDSSATEHVILNPNVLIEIGAAMGLYGRSFILLVKSGTTLPSNLQGLFEVRYSGDTLDGDATIRLMEAIHDLKKVADEKQISQKDSTAHN